MTITVQAEPIQQGQVIGVQNQPVANVVIVETDLMFPSGRDVARMEDAGGDALALGSYYMFALACCLCTGCLSWIPFYCKSKSIQKKNAKGAYN